MYEGFRRIIHIDLDAFFSSVEQRDNPGLIGKPVAVGGSRERGVVAAASYEARRYGVKSAMPSVMAARLCPELVFVPPRFEVYRQVSNEIREIFLGYTDLVEPLSLDEAYLDVTATHGGTRYATRTAREVRAAILQRTRLTASAGISYNKFLSKLGSDCRKPNGQYTITPDMGAAFIERLDVGRIHGVGPATESKMQSLGIRTGADLRQHSEAFLIQHFGKIGHYFYKIALGEDDRPVVADRPRKSSGSETTFDRDLHELTELQEALQCLIDDVWGWRERSGISGRTVTVKIKYSDFEQATRSRTAVQPVASRSEMTAIGLELLASVFPLRRPVRLLGITISNFDFVTPEHGPQMNLGF
jgi:DNA polymerase-4